MFLIPYIQEQEGWEPLSCFYILMSVKAAFAEDPAKELKALPCFWHGVGVVEKVVEGLLPFS